MFYSYILTVKTWEMVNKRVIENFEIWGKEKGYCAKIGEANSGGVWWKDGRDLGKDNQRVCIYVLMFVYVCVCMCVCVCICVCMYISIYPGGYTLLKYAN